MSSPVSWLRRTLLLSGIFGLCALVAMQQTPGAAQNPPQPQTRSAAAESTAPASPAGEGFTLLVLLGCNDSESRDWSGDLAIADGQVTAIEGWKFFGTDEVTSRTAWVYHSAREKAPAAIAGEALHWVPYPPGRLETGGLLVTGRAEAGALLVLSTRQGSFGVRLAELDWAFPVERLGGAVRLVRLPSHTRLSGELRENDFPDIAAAPDGTLWAVWVSYSGGRDELHLAQFRNGVWHAPTPVPGVSGDVWRPRVALEADGAVWVVWAQQAAGNWDLQAAALRGDAWLPPQRLTSDPGVDFNVRVATGPDGRLRAVWQGVRGGVSHIWSLERDRRGDGWSNAVAISEGPGNDWNPAVAVDSAGRTHVVWDTYRNGNYDVYRRTIRPDRTLEPEAAVAASPRYEANPAIAVDSEDRVWLAWEEGPVNWGKDRGYTLPNFGPGAAVGENMEIRVAALERSGTPMAPAEPPAAAFAEPERRFLRYPALAIDRTGRPWLAFRHMIQAGIGPGIAGRYYWAAYATSYQDGRWRPAMLLPESPGRISSFPALAAGTDRMWVAWNGDGRRYGAITRPGQNQVFAGEVKLPRSFAPPPRLVAAAREEARETAPVHPGESADVRALRDYRAQVGGHTYRIVRGDLHRHTELSQDLGGSADGSLLDFYRYMIDGAAMDFGAVTDHQMGGGNDYWYWYTQKTTDLFHWTPAYTALFGYERSVTYPNGHRNILHARRGVPVVDFFTRSTLRGRRPPVSGNSDFLLANDTKLLYAALRESGGIAISHTSGTRMGTDWRDNDPAVEPVVEIFQGCRNSYEAAGAPKSPDPERDKTNLAPPHMGYLPDGFVSNAWQKGYRLGVIASSDHSSVHYSYALVYTESTDRAAVIDAIRKRRTYGATDNILLDVRSGNHFMGEEWVSAEPLRIAVKARGTSALARVTVVRNNQAVFSRDLDARDANLVYQDTERPPEGGATFYYVRVEQRDGQIAWSSPMWVRTR
jgi:hypothetical protein